MPQNSRQNRNRKRKATLKLVKKAIADGKFDPEEKPRDAEPRKKDGSAKD